MNTKYNIKQSYISIVTLIIFSTSIAIAEEFKATLAWSKRVELSVPVNGLVQKVYAQTGNVVAKGDVLVQLDPRSFKADLKYAKARLNNTNEQSIEAKRELDRQLDMYDRSMLSDHDLQIAKNNYSSAQSNHIQAQAALTKANLNLEYSAIRAPFNAIVIKTKAVKGLVVASEIMPPILVVVAEAKRMHAKFFIADSKVNDLVLNQSVKVNIASQSYQGKIFSVDLEPDKSKVDHYVVKVVFDLKDKVLRAGQKATVEL